MFISPNLLKPHFKGSPNMTVKFESDQEDFVSKEVHPINYVKDGLPDYKFVLDISSFFPIKLNRINILFLDGEGETWVSTANRRAKSKLWGVGMVNEYGKNINFQASEIIKFTKIIICLIQRKSIFISQFLIK
jgi:hypothetical protein